MYIASGSWFTGVSWLENTIEWQNKINITIKVIWVHPLICTSGHTYTCYCASADKKRPQTSAHARVEKLTRTQKCMNAARMRWHAYTHVYWSDHNYKHTHVCAFYIWYTRRHSIPFAWKVSSENFENRFWIFEWAICNENTDESFTFLSLKSGYHAFILLT